MTTDKYKHPDYVNTGYEEFCPFYENFFTDDFPVRTVDNEIQALELCISLGADFNSSLGLKSCRFLSGETVLSLYLSSNKCRKETVQFLLDNGSDPKKIIVYNNPTPVETYIRNNAFNLDIFEIIDEHIKHNDENGYLNYLNSILLYYTSKSTHCKSYIIKTLISKGADPSYTATNGYNPLMGCLSNLVRYPTYGLWSNISCQAVDILLDNGANVKTRSPKLGKTPLIMACNVNRNEKMITHMIKLGADVNICDNDGFTPVMRYMMNTYVNLETIKLLLDKDSNVNKRDSKKGLTLIMRFATRQTVDTSTLGFLLRRGCNVYMTDKSGKGCSEKLEKRIGLGKYWRSLLSERNDLMKCRKRLMKRKIGATNDFGRCILGIGDDLFYNLCKFL